MWRYMGVEREARGLTEFLRQLDGWSKMISAHEYRRPEEWQLENMLVVAEAMVRSALIREESRGVHQRGDFPATDPGWVQRHVEVRRTGGAVVV